MHSLQVNSATMLISNWSKRICWAQYLSIYLYCPIQYSAKPVKWTLASSFCMQEHGDTTRGGLKATPSRQVVNFTLGMRSVWYPSITLHSSSTAMKSLPDAISSAFWHTNSPAAPIHMEGFHRNLFAVSHWRACIPRGLHFKWRSRLPKCIRLKKQPGLCLPSLVRLIYIDWISDRLADAIIRAVCFWSNVVKQLHKCKFPLLLKDQ